MLAVDREQETATPPVRDTASSPAATRLSLFASASVMPCSSAHRVASTPAKPTMALSTMSGSPASRSCRGWAADLDVLDAVERRELGERLCARHQRAELELRVSLDDLDRLAADRAGCTEEGDTLHDMQGA